jgi:hypothetical protein
LSKIKFKQDRLSAKLEDTLSKYYFDVQGINPGVSLDEAYLARVFTKIAVGSATVWWSLLELKDFLELRRNLKRRKSSGISRKDSF